MLESKMPRNLDHKIKLLGFELMDLLLIFLYLSISNLIFGQTALKFLLVWIGTILLTVTLYFFKKGKPENYISDFLSSYLNSSVFSANLSDTKHKPYFKGRGK